MKMFYTLGVKKGDSISHYTQKVQQGPEYWNAAGGAGARSIYLTVWVSKVWQVFLNWNIV